VPGNFPNIPSSKPATPLLSIINAHSIAINPLMFSLFCNFRYETPARKIPTQNPEMKAAKKVNTINQRIMNKIRFILVMS
jgi:hypothetical protein